MTSLRLYQMVRWFPITLEIMYQFHRGAIESDPQLVCVPSSTAAHILPPSGSEAGQAGSYWSPLKPGSSLGCALGEVLVLLHTSHQLLALLKLLHGLVSPFSSHGHRLFDCVCLLTLTSFYHLLQHQPLYRHQPSSTFHCS